MLCLHLAPCELSFRVATRGNIACRVTSEAVKKLMAESCLQAKQLFGFGPQCQVPGAGRGSRALSQFAADQISVFSVNWPESESPIKTGSCA
jgi:hypothetical protein